MVIIRTPGAPLRCSMSYIVSLLVSALVFGSIIFSVHAQTAFALKSNWIAPSSDGLDQVYHPRNELAYGSQVQMLELAALSSEDFVTVGHQSFPSYQVRVKRVEGFCDTTVR